MSKKTIIKSAGIISSATLLSRILGFIRDILMAHWFGSGPVADAFFAAFRIPNVLRRLFGEGAMSSVFIPLFAEYDVKYGKEESHRFASAMFNLLAAVLAIVSALGSLFAPQIIALIDSGFSDEKAVIASQYLEIMFPYLFFVGLTALLMGILNSMRHFLFPALSPVMLNIVLIAVMYLTFSGNTTLRENGTILSQAVVAGGFLQLILQIPVLLKKGFSYSFCFSHPGVKRALIMMLPAIGALAVHEVNLMVDDWFTSHIAGNGAFSYLYYGNRLMQFPLGVFGIAISTALLPVISREIAQQNISMAKDYLVYSSRIIIFITVPCTAGLIGAGFPLISFMFQRGQFTEESSWGSYTALAFYSIGLLGYSAVKILIPVFYSLGDSITPFKTGVISVIVNIVLNAAFVKPLAHGGLALASSIAAFVHAGLLIYLLRKKIGILGYAAIIQNTIKILFIAAAMGMICWQLNNFLHILILIPAGVLIFAGLSALLKIQEFNETKALIRKKFARQ